MEIRVTPASFIRIMAVGVENGMFKRVPERRVDRVGNVAVGAVAVFAAGHHDKQLFLRLNDLDVVHGKLVVECDRCDRAERRRLKGPSDFDIGNFHRVHHAFAAAKASFLPNLPHCGDWDA